MSIPTKGSRRIRVGGREYRWLVRKKPTYQQGAFASPMRVAIQSCDTTATCVVVASLSSSRPDNWIRPHQTSLTPATVAAIIERALAEGWNPSSPASTFELELGSGRDQPSRGIRFENGEESIIAADVEALVNPVNCAGVMGKGLALAFKRAFPGVFREYARACSAGEVVLGRVQVVDTGAKTPKYVINFPTKDHWRGKSRLDDIKTGVADLIAQVRKREIRSIAIPALGCGLGGLPWSTVRAVIQSTFVDLGGANDLRVVLFAPRD